MKYLFLFALLALPALAQTPLSISGVVSSSKECLSKEAMVWLSVDAKDRKDKILLSHTQVPERGSFKFYVKPGRYLVVASNDKGCSWEKSFEVKAESVSIAPSLTEAQEKKL